MGDRQIVQGQRLSKRLKHVSMFVRKYPRCGFSAVVSDGFGRVRIAMKCDAFWQLVREEGAVEAVQVKANNPHDPMDAYSYLWVESEFLTFSTTGEENAHERLADLPRLEIRKPTERRPERPRRDEPDAPVVVRRRSR